jgi:hypothetical protein
MQSTHTGKFVALSDVPPLDLRFLYLNQKFLVYSHARSGCALQGRLKNLADRDSGKNMRGYPWVESLGIEPGRSYTEYSFRPLLFVPEVLNDMRRAMVDFPDVFRPTVSSGCLFSIISEIYGISTLIFTDVSKSDDGTGFGLYVPNVWQVGCCLHEPLSVFTEVISTLLDALLFIKSSQPGEYLICLRV